MAESANQDNSTSPDLSGRTALIWTVMTLISCLAIMLLVVQMEKMSKIRKAKASVAYDLLDPESAQFRNVETSDYGYVCGEVNAKNSYGAYTGFKWFSVDFNDGMEPRVDTGEGVMGMEWILRYCQNHPEYNPDP